MAKIDQPEPDNPDEGSGPNTVLKDNDLVLRPVSAGETGEGLPYAPVDWPNPGDVWKWRVGKRIVGSSGFMADRYLIPPSRLDKPGQPKLRFASMSSVKTYITKEFPEADIDAFFASFSWKIPAKTHNWEKGESARMHPKKEIAGNSGLESDAKTKDCKAGNKMCVVHREAKSPSLPAMDCDICCSEIGFCRNCCCILCCRTIDWAHGGYSFIRCEAKLGENHVVCGHVAHVDCALRSYLAGTVGERIALNVEYLCRRCDSKTDLISHVTRLLQAYESLNSRDDMEKILKVGLCILQGSKRDIALKLLYRVESALAKLRAGSYLEEIWNIEDVSVVSTGLISRLGNNVALPEDLVDKEGQNPPNLVAAGRANAGKRFEVPAYLTSDKRIDSKKLEDEIVQVLQDLKKSQEYEYRIAEEKLYAKKAYLLSLDQQLDEGKIELVKQSSSTTDINVDEALLSSTLNKVKQIKQEVMKLKDMEEISKGFGRTPKGTLNEHFGLHIED